MSTAKGQVTHVHKDMRQLFLSSSFRTPARRLLARRLLCWYRSRGLHGDRRHHHLLLLLSVNFHVCIKRRASNWSESAKWPDKNKNLFLLKMGSSFRNSVFAKQQHSFTILITHFVLTNFAYLSQVSYHLQIHATQVFC